MISIDEYSSYAPLVARLGIGAVFMWFGWSGITNTDMWLPLVPAWTAAIASPETLVMLHGWFELIFGALLFFGIYIRVVSLLLGLNLLHTIYLLGSGPVMIRDIGLFATLVSVFLYGKKGGVKSIS